MARVRWSHDLLAGIGNGVVSLVFRHLDSIAVSSSQDIVLTVALVVDVFGAHEGSHTAVLVVVLKGVAIVCLVVLLVQQVVSSSTMILLSCIELVFFDRENVLGSNIGLLHVFKSVHLSVITLFTKMSPAVLNVIKLRSTNFLIGNREVFIKPLLL